MKRTAVRFPNKDGLMLHAILEQPDSDIQRDIGILLLSPGIKMRVAPHKLYNKMSEHFLEQGYSVLRFDFHGLGDAEGCVEEEFLADLYGSIQVGRYVDDTLIAIDWMAKQLDLQRFILAGLCGGAITGLLTAKSDDRVEGLLGLGIPVVLDSSKMDMSKYITSGHINRLHKGYIRRLLSLKSWMRLFTFQSDYRVIWKVIKQKLNIGASKKAVKSQSSSDNTEVDDNTNPLFAPAFFDMLDRHKKILFVFSGSDRLDWEYEEKIVSRYASKLGGYKNDLEVTTIPEANHILSLPQWQQQMFEISEQWLKKYF